MKMKKTLPSLFDETPVYEQFYPKITPIETKDVPTNLWDIPFTIKQLSYLTHDHYRYYGKFPPPVAGEILKQYKPNKTGQYVLDNFCGSGTTLVEAKLRGIKSYGVDISWVSALVSNVKSNFFDINILEKIFLTIDDVKQSEVEIPIDFELNYAQKWFSKN